VSTESPCKIPFSFKKLKLKKINLTQDNLPRTPKTKIWFQGILGVKIQHS
jgi:hypothetical protein